MAHRDTQEINIDSKYPPFPIPNVSIGEYLYTALSNYDQEEIILIDAKTDVKLTIKEYISQARIVALELVKYGITKEDIFFFDGFNSIPYAVCLLAAFFLGNTITTSQPTNNVYEVSKHISNSGSNVVFSDNSLASIVKQAIDELKDKQKIIKLKICLDGKFDGFLFYGKILKHGQETGQKLIRIPYFDVDDPSNDVGIIMYTSGTTGPRKGVRITHRSLVSRALFCSKLNILAGQRGVSMHYPFGHGSGIFIYQVCLSQGSFMVLVAVPKLDIVLAACQKYRIPYLGLFPAMGEALLSGQYDEYDLSNVLVMVFGGTSIKGTVVKALTKKYNLKHFLEVYSMAECLIPAIHNLNDNKFVFGSVGQVSPHMQMKIIDLQTGQSLPSGESGEICFRGPLVFKDYTNNEEVTAIDENGWLHTGDVGYYNCDGYLFITDRIKEMIKFRHFVVFPTEIEACLLEYKGIAEVVVIGVKHETEGEWIRAYVKVKEGKRINENNIHQYMKERMGDQKQLRAGIVFMDSSIPRTVIGKVDRQHFKKLIKDEIISA